MGNTQQFWLLWLAIWEYGQAQLAHGTLWEAYVFLPDVSTDSFLKDPILRWNTKDIACFSMCFFTPQKPLNCFSPPNRSHPRSQFLVVSSPTSIVASGDVGYQRKREIIYPIGSMYGIYANIWGILMVNVTIYSIHGSYGYSWSLLNCVILSPLDEFTMKIPGRNPHKSQEKSPCVDDFPIKPHLKKKKQQQQPPMGPHPLPPEIMQQRLQQPSQRRFAAM